MSKKPNHAPFRGRGILGSGWQRQTCPVVKLEPGVPLLLALLRARSAILGGKVAVSVFREAARFRVICWGGEIGVDGSECLFRWADLREAGRLESVKMLPKELRVFCIDKLGSNMSVLIIANYSGGKCGREVVSIRIPGELRLLKMKYCRQDEWASSPC